MARYFLLKGALSIAHPNETTLGIKPGYNLVSKLGGKAEVQAGLLPGLANGWNNVSVSDMSATCLKKDNSHFKHK